jgi:predicted nucleic acid-binding Zn ribbon protein
VTLCDVCDSPIGSGTYRYKCLQCTNFNLCTKCEQHAHHRHLMIRFSDDKLGICNKQSKTSFATKFGSPVNLQYVHVQVSVKFGTASQAVEVPPQGEKIHTS